MRDLSAIQAATFEGYPASLAAEYPVCSAAHQAGQVPVSNRSRQSQKQQGAPKLTTPFEHPPLLDIIDTIAGGKPGGEGSGT